MLALAALLCLNGCDKGEDIENQAPETRISVEAINLSGENRLNSLVEIKWWGTDPDGYVTGYEFSFDGINWHYTLGQDSTFRFAITEGSDTIDIDFWVRSIDDQDTRDDSPAYLKIPLKNTAPEVTFLNDLIPSDTVFNLLTIAWKATDLDGFSSIKSVEIRLNNGAWLSFSPRMLEEGVELGSIIPIDPNANGNASAHFYSEMGDLIGTLESLEIMGMNDLFIRVVDLAGSISLEDTLAQFYFKGKSSEMLLIGTSSENPNAFYHSNLNLIGADFDFIDMARDGRKNQPKIWNPYVELLLSQYEKVVLFCKDDLVTNAQTNQDDIFLEFAAAGIQTYVNDGGKIWIISSLPNLHSPTSVLYGILPMDSLSSSPLPSQARLPIDSLAEGLNGFPDLTSNALITIDPFYVSSDAEVIYTAQLTKSLGWYGPEDGCIGARRKIGGQTSMVFMSVDLHKLNKNSAATQALFDKVINQEF